MVVPAVAFKRYVMYDNVEAPSGRKVRAIKKSREKTRRKNSSKE
jgi:hypothetical protein